MHSSCSFLMLLLPPLLLLVATVGPAGALTDEEKHLMVELHNLYRAQTSPPASDMLHMRWDEELAAFAKAYARQCVWGHNKERGRRGENLFAITDEGMDVPLAMEEWYHEREHYNLSAATCSPGQMCGHYTQPSRRSHFGALSFQVTGFQPFKPRMLESLAASGGPGEVGVATR
ncbi:Peptidase inhibitor 16 [Saguinus oedipus]|uniref:Peptidase inhibitor 16 n=1 Tax=Saguinus oedipus TaxID=9490 RepID=A0ABQ9VW97_SAGOE|nr:Peptidase inhibitor 16 [Saguinus oedipus]